MIYCPNCSRPTVQTKLVCPHCGAKLPTPQPKVMPGPSPAKQPAQQARAPVANNPGGGQAAGAPRQRNQPQKKAIAAAPLPMKKPDKSTVAPLTLPGEENKARSSSQPAKRPPPPRHSSKPPKKQPDRQHQKQQKPQPRQKTRLRLGEILIGAGIITLEQLEFGLIEQKKSGLKLGQILVEEAIIDESELVQALSHQANVPWIDLWRTKPAPNLVEIIPSETAQKHKVFPVDIRQVKDGRRVLYLAMDDITDKEALRSVEGVTGMHVQGLFAAPSAIVASIEKHYNLEPEQKPVTEVGPENKTVSSVPPTQPRKPTIAETEDTEPNLPPKRVVEIPLAKPPAKPLEKPPEEPPGKPDRAPAEETAEKQNGKQEDKPPARVVLRQIKLVKARRATDPEPRVEEPKQVVEEKEQEEAPEDNGADKEPAKRATERWSSTTLDQRSPPGSTMKLTLLDGTAIPTPMQAKEGFLESPEKKKLSSELLQLAEHPENASELREYLEAVIEVLLEKNLMSVDEIHKLVDSRK